MDPAMYRIHAGSPRASPYDAAMLLQAYDLDYNHKNPSDRLWRPAPLHMGASGTPAPYISAFIATKPHLSPGNKKRPVYVIVHRSDNFTKEII